MARAFDRDEHRSRIAPLHHIDAMPQLIDLEHIRSWELRPIIGARARRRRIGRLLGRNSSGVEVGDAVHIQVTRFSERFTSVMWDVK